MEEAIKLFALIVEGAIPYGIVFALGQLIVNTFMGMAFGGRINFGGMHG